MRRGSGEGTREERVGRGSINKMPTYMTYQFPKINLIIMYYKYILIKKEESKKEEENEEKESLTKTALIIMAPFLTQ